MNDIFKNALEKNKIAGAYIIEGNSSEGIKQEIDDFLIKVFCKTHQGCKQCSGCKKYLNENHIDVFYTKKTEKSIKIDDVRGIPDFVYQKSFESGYKAVVILESNLLTTQAQNALLKVIEEPPENTVFILGSVNINNILPTILSRCVRIKQEYKKIDINEVMKECDIDKNKAIALLSNAKGDYHVAIKFFNANFFNMRDNVFEVASKILNAKNMATSVMLNSILEYEGNLKIYFTLLNMCICDIILFKNTHSFSEVINKDKEEFILSHCTISNYVLANMFETIGKTTSNMEMCAGLNIKLAIEAMLFDIIKLVLEGKNV